MKITRKRIEEILKEEIVAIREKADRPSLADRMDVDKDDDLPDDGDLGAEEPNLVPIPGDPEEELEEMQGTHTYAYANSMPAKRDELDEWLAEALEERTDDEARSELERLRGDMQQAAAAAKGKPQANPPKKKGSAVGKAAKAGVMGAGLYQVVQAFKGLKGASEAAIQQVMSQLDPEMVATIADAAQSVGQAVGLEENLDTPMMPAKPVKIEPKDE